MESKTTHQSGDERLIAGDRRAGQASPGRFASVPGMAGA